MSTPSKPMRMFARVSDDVAVVFYPPANPQFGFRGTYALRIINRATGKLAETILTHHEIAGLRRALGDIDD